MKDLRKLIAAPVITIMVIMTMMSALADSYSYLPQTNALYNIGVLKGSTVGTFEPDLEGPLDRQQGVVMLLRLLGKEAAAFSLSSTDVNSTLSIFSDKDKIADWARKHAAYSVRYKLVAGLPDGTFAPNKALSGKEYCTMLLRALGYTVDAAGYPEACFQLSALGGITFAEATKFNEKNLIRDDFVGISFGVLQINYYNTTTSMIKSLVTSNIVTEANAIAAGLYNKQLEADARAAVDAYKAGAISTFAEIAVVESKKAAADAAVAKIIVAATKTTLQAEINTRAAAVAAAKAAITMKVAVYYLKNNNNVMYLVREIHEVEKSAGVARAALNELISGEPATPEAFRILPEDTIIKGITIENGLATIDFSKEVLNVSIGAIGEGLGIASIVNTLTEFPTVQKVQFTVDGNAENGMDWWGHIGLYGQPFQRDLSMVYEPVIWVIAPVDAQIITSPVWIKGSARIFEAMVSFRLKEADGNILASGTTMAEAGAPDRGDFEVVLPFSPLSANKGQLEVYEVSMKDGSDLNMVIIMVAWE